MLFYYLWEPSVKDLKLYMKELGTTEKELEYLLDAAACTIKQWNSPEKFPRRIKLLLDAWVRLQEKGVNWRPSHETIQA